MSHSQHFNAKGIKIPSVSEIPGMFVQDISGFEDWICRGLHEKEAKCCIRAKREFYQESADLGNDIHNLREAFLKGEAFEDGVPEYQAQVFEPVAKFYKDNGYKPLFIEHKMTGGSFGGTLDGCGTFSKPFWEEQRKTFWDKSCGDLRPSIGDIWVDDLKIKSKLDTLHPLQLHGYSDLLKEKENIIAKWGLIIRREKKLHKRPEIQLKAYYLPYFKKYWDASMLMWKFLNQ